MKQLDEDGSGYRSVIERELQSRLSTRAAEGNTGAGTAEARAAVNAAAEIAPTARACTCGTENDVDALFCKRCGNRLTPASAAQ
jgi:hypothetical protein